MDFYFITLAILFTLSNVFWAVVSFKLINRLMSRNFYEYKVADGVGADAKVKAKKNTDYGNQIPPEVLAELDQLNGRILG